jgi:hypothetical protein
MTVHKCTCHVVVLVGEDVGITSSRILALFSLVWSMLTMESGRVEILYILWDMAEARSPTSRD